MSLGEAPPRPAAAPSPAAGKTEPPAGASAAKNAPAAPPGFDALKIPTGAVLVICKEVKDALELVPGSVVLTPERYQAMQEQIDRLKAQVVAAQPLTPSSCTLSGQVEGEVVRFQAKFGFVTDKPRALVALGCQRAWPKGASLDGRLPMLLPADDGLMVQVDTPGTHELTLDLELLLTAKGTKGSEREFDFGLPRAAITILEQLSLAGSVPEIRLTYDAPPTEGRRTPQVVSRWLKAKIAGDQSRLEDTPLGPVNRLNLSWKEPLPGPQKGPPMLAADAQVTVRVDEARVTTEAELTLKVLRGETGRWRLQVPPQALPDVKDERVESIDPPAANKPFLTIQLKKPSAEPLVVKLQVRQGRSTAPTPVGPFFVFDTVRQQGNILVTAPPDVQLKYRPYGDVSQRDVPDNRRGDNVAAFSYWNLPATGPALDLEVETVKGSVETRVSHTLRLEPGRGWHLTTKIDVTPIRTGVEQLDVALPPDYQYQEDAGASPAELVENPVEIKAASPEVRVAHLKLAQKQRGPFSVTLPGLYPFAGDAHEAAVRLPHPLQTLDRGGQVTVELPEDVELVAGDAAAPALQPAAREHTYGWRSDHAPARVELAWRKHVAELAVRATADVTLTPRKAWVRQRLDVHFSQKPPGQVTLQLPGDVQGVLRVTQGNKQEPLGPQGEVALGDRASKEQALTLDYSFPLPEAAANPTDPRSASDPARRGRRFAVPLVRVEGATRSETKVRVWSDPGVQPVLAAGPWEEQRIEATEQESLPALVLRSVNLDTPLSLRQLEPSGAPLAGIVIDRALVQAAIGDGGHQTYRARFLLDRLNTRSLEVEFPAPAAGLKPEVYLQGKRVTQWQTGDGGTSLHLAVEPDLYREPVILDVRYQVPPEAIGGSNALQTALYPPVLRGDVFLGRIRWRVTCPQGWVTLYQGGGYTSEQGWEWRGGLWTPHPAVTAADLESWLAAPASAGGTWAGPDTGPPSLVCWRSALTPLHFFHVPQQAWLLGCSLIFLVVGLVLLFLPLPRGVLWTIVTLIVAAVGLAAVWIPSALPAVLYGFEPGAVAFVLILGIQWMVQQRYRRQVIFLPGFSRLKSPSALISNGSRSRGEPSTVDGPVPQGSESSRQKAEGSRQ